MADFYYYVAGPAAQMIPIVQEVNFDWNCIKTTDIAKDILDVHDTILMPRP